MSSFTSPTSTAPASAEAPPRTEPLLGLSEQAALVATGEASSVELVDDAFARIDATQPTLNAFRLICPDDAFAAAEAADAVRARGVRGPLLGVPIAIKDDMHLRGHPTAMGCAGDHQPRPEDGELARRLKTAGAVIVGKTNTPEFGLYPFTEGPGFGVTRNPWHLHRTPGGSSGGSAAAVAAGLVPAAMGSDGAGSIRIPAAWTHLVGLKPQRGRVSTWPDVDAFEGLACNGPLARTVADAALLLDAAAGSHAADVHRPPPAAEPFSSAARQDPGTLRIGLSFKAPFIPTRTRLDPEVRAATERIAAVLAEARHTVEHVDVPYRIEASFLARSLAAVSNAATDSVPDPSLLDPRTREVMRTGRRLGGRALRLARRRETALATRIGRVFKGVDVILTPTTASLPLPIGAAEGLSGFATDRLIAAACPYAWVWNMLGWPAISVPSGLSTAGLPMGAQLLGRPNDETTLISLAAQLEVAERWYEQRPPPLAEA